MASTIIGEVLRECYSELELGFYSGHLVSHLYSNGVNGDIGIEEKQNVEACATQIDKSRKLMDYLMNKADHVLQTLVEYFNQYPGCEHLSRIIRESAESHGFQFRQAGQGGRTYCERRRLVLPTKWWPVFKELIRPEAFVERQFSEELNLIQHFRQELEESDFGTSPTISKKIVIVGMAGVGKSMTAKWYANVYQEQYDHILWIDSEGASLEKSFRNLSQEFGMDCGPQLEIQVLARRIQQRLVNVRCLFIFDNAESFDGKNGLKNLMPRNELHHTIITSRNQHWGNPNELGRMFTWHVGTFTAEECVCLLSRTLDGEGKGGTRTEMEAMGAELQFLPLAIQIGIATILNSKSCTLKSYLKRIQENIRLLIADKKILSEYDRSIWATLQLSINQIEKNEEVEKNCRDMCKTLLFVAAYCQPSGIQEFMFEQLPKGTDSKVNDALDILLQYSLLSFEYKFNTSTYGMHRLLQHVVRETATENLELATRAIGMIMARFRMGYFANAEVGQHALYAWRFQPDEVEKILSTNPNIQQDEIVISCNGCWTCLKSMRRSLLEMQRRPIVGKLDLSVMHDKFKLMDNDIINYDWSMSKLVGIHLPETIAMDEYLKQVRTFFGVVFQQVESEEANTTSILI